MNKQILRNKYKEIRKKIKNKEKQDNIIFNKIINLEEYKQSNLILTYVSLRDEVDTIKLIKHSLDIGKNVAVPKCKGDNIVFYKINTLEDLEEGKFGILEPETKEVVNDFDNSICIIPGIAFDKQNNRIGYGRGFYDRFLENYKGIKIGLAYKECICDKIDADENDIKMDKVIFLMKIMCISDIHGNVECLNKTLERYREENAEKLIILGDFSGYYFSSSDFEVAEILNNMAGSIVAVKGNCDSSETDNLFNFELGYLKTVDVNGIKVTITHGHIYDRNHLPENCGDIFLSGHTHIGNIEKINEKLIANPGSISKPRGGAKKSYLTIDENNIELKSLDGETIKKLII